MPISATESVQSFTKNPIKFFLHFTQFFCWNFVFLGYKEVLKLLIDKGANINALNKANLTALDAAFQAIEGKLENLFFKKYMKYFNFFCETYLFLTRTNYLFLRFIFILTHL